MIKTDLLTYLNIDECIEILKEIKPYTKEDIETLVNEQNLHTIIHENKTYIRSCDLNFLKNKLNHHPFIEKADYFGAIGIDLRELTLKPTILDIGGGGEGIIGQIYKNAVIAIDPSKRELEEAPEGPIKIVMNAKEMTFIDETFATATSFFTFMFIPNEDHQKVFEEVYRVLKPNGEFILWDIVIPEFQEHEKDSFVIYLQIELPDHYVTTGYGNKRDNKKQDINYFLNLGEETGFMGEVLEKMSDNSFCIKFKKK